MIESALAEQLGVTVERKRIINNVAIKTAGKHEVEIHLYREIRANIFVLVGDVELEDETEAPAEEVEAE